MLARPIQKLPDYVYPSDEWRLVEKRFYPRLLAQTETLFATANGYLGLRGSPEEGAPAHYPGTFVNGFHEIWPIVYGERAFGFARTGQTMIPLPESHLIRLYVDDEPFDVSKANLIHYERALDMRAGTLNREVVWEKHSGKRVRIRSRRLVSFVHRHLAAIEYEVELLNADAPLVLCSQLLYQPGGLAGTDDPRATRAFTNRVLLPEHRRAHASRILLGFVTQNSRMRLACGIDHRLNTDCPHTERSECREDAGQILFSVEAKAGQTIHLTKMMTYHSSRAHAMYHFISGYTAKVAGTEVGVTEPQATFSPCFGGPFLVWHPSKYAELLAVKMKQHNARVWLVNTGWGGGAHGTGKRISLKNTRAIVDAIHSGALARASTQKDSVFGFDVVTECPGVPAEILVPRNAWADKAGYDATAKKLATLFRDNFKAYAGGVSGEVKAAGPA